MFTVCMCVCAGVHMCLDDRDTTALVRCSWQDCWTVTLL